MQEKELDETLEAFKKYFRRSYLPTRNPADASKHEMNPPLTKAASAEHNDVTCNSDSGFFALRKVPIC
jgi:hypothetical protein